MRNDIVLRTLDKQADTYDRMREQDTSLTGGIAKVYSAFTKPSKVKLQPEEATVADAVGVRWDPKAKSWLLVQERGRDNYNALFRTADIARSPAGQKTVQQLERYLMAARSRGDYDMADRVEGLLSAYDTTNQQAGEMGLHTRPDIPTIEHELKKTESESGRLSGLLTAARNNQLRTALAEGRGPLKVPVLPGYAEVQADLAQNKAVEADLRQALHFEKALGGVPGATPADFRKLAEDRAQAEQQLGNLDAAESYTKLALSIPLVAATGGLGGMAGGSLSAARWAPAVGHAAGVAAGMWGPEMIEEAAKADPGHRWAAAKEVAPFVPAVRSAQAGNYATAATSAAGDALLPYMPGGAKGLAALMVGLPVAGMMAERWDARRAAERWDARRAAERNSSQPVPATAPDAELAARRQVFRDKFRRRSLVEGRDVPGRVNTSPFDSSGFLKPVAGQ